MPVERFFINQPLKKDEVITLEGDEHLHLSQVVRTRVGDHVEIFNGKGSVAKAEVASIDRRKTKLTLHSVHTNKKPGYQLIIAQGLPQQNRLDFIIEKATELGVTEIRLFPGERSERKDISPNRLIRLNRIVIAAAKQSGRLWLPEITLAPSIDKWKAEKTPLYYGDIAESAPRLSDCMDLTKSSALIVIGPESGLSNEEIADLKKMGAIGASLSDHILRTDTAAITAAAIAYNCLRRPVAG